MPMSWEKMVPRKDFRRQPAVRWLKDKTKQQILLIFVI